MRKNTKPPTPQTPGVAKHYASAPPDRPKEPEVMQWKNLFTLADEMRRTEPWKWMEASWLFAIRIPETERIYYCRFTGHGAELPGFLAFRGTRGLCHHALALRGLSPRSLERSLTRDALALSFGTKKTMDKDDRALLASLKRFYRGGDVWPRFRSQIPCAPESTLNAFEAEDFAPVLSQALVVASACRTNPQLPAGPEPAPGRVLLREGTWDEDGGISWENHWISTAVEELRAELFPGERLLQELGDGVQELSQRSGTWHLTLQEGPAGDPEENLPVFVLQGVLEEEDGKFSEPLGGKSSGSSPWEAPLGQLFARFRARGALPERVVVHSPLLHEALGDLFRRLGVALDVQISGDEA